MDLTRAAARTRQRSQHVVGTLQVRLGLTTRGVLALGVALLAALVTAVVAAGVGEDVLFRNGEYREDPAHLGWFVGHRVTVEVDAAKLLAVVGSVGVLLALGVATLGVLVWRRVPLAIAAAPLTALLGAGATAGVLKSLVGRDRPPAALQLVRESAASFPSGHSTDTAAFAIALGLVLAVVVFRRPLARMVAVTVAVALSAAVALSRLVLGVHWPTDVLEGAAIGTLAALAVVVTAVIVTRLDGVEGRVGSLLRLARWQRP